MKLTCVTTSIVGTNTYIIDTGKSAVVVDPGDDIEKIDRVLTALGRRCTAVLLTHGHFDHCNACAALQARGAKVYLHELDDKLIRDGKNLAAENGIAFHAFTPDVTVADGDTFDLDGIDFKVLHTPGHTAGSVCYVTSNVIFSGDTLFFLSVGRTDFPTGDADALRRSVREKLFTLEGDYTVYPGHDRPTTLVTEKENNPCV